MILTIHILIEQTIPMADGTILFADGLGFKALDSNEIRRKQRTMIESLADGKIHSDASPNLGFEPGNPNLKNPLSNFSGEVDFGAAITSFGPLSTPRWFGAHSPKLTKNPSPDRKLQQVFFERGFEAGS